MPATALLTSEQYLALPDQYDKNGNRIKDELIAGEIVRMPPASRIHDLIKNRINKILIRYLDSHPEVLLETVVEIGAEISKQDVFIPDVGVFSRERLFGEGRIVRGAPEIAIGVVSPVNAVKHLKRKVDAYLANGSQSVWVALPDSRSIVVHTSSSMRELKANQVLEDPLLPGFSIPVSSLFELT